MPHIFHEVAELFLGADVTLRQQLVVGGFHGDLADFQVFGQRPLGGELVTGLQLMAQNIRTDTPVEGLVQRHTRGLLQFVS